MFPPVLLPVPDASAPLAPRVSYDIDADLPERFAAFARTARSFRHVSDATVTWYRQTLAIFLKFLAARGVTAIDAGAPALIVDWIASACERAEKPLSPFTARSYFQGLRAFFVYLEETDGFPNPFRRLKPPRVPVDPFPKALTFAECVRVLDAAENTAWADAFERTRAAAMLGVALYTGLRRGEILRLKFREHVELEERRIRVVDGKGGVSRVGFINDELGALLRAYVDARRRAKLESVEFFTSRHGGAGVGVKTFARIVARVRATAGIRFSLHMLRHSFVTFLARNHTAPHLIRGLAGHRDLKTTQRYTRLFEEDLRAEVERLAFRAPTTPPGPSLLLQADLDAAIRTGGASMSTGP